MKKTMAILLILALFLLGCAETKTIDGITYDSYGLFNKGEKHNPEIQYEIIWGHVILAASLVHTIIAPIYFWGFSMWQPVGKKTNVIGQVVKQRSQT